MEIRPTLFTSFWVNVDSYAPKQSLTAPPAITRSETGFVQ
jgi:hypothetical protein